VKWRPFWKNNIRLFYQHKFPSMQLKGIEPTRFLLLQVSDSRRRQHLLSPRALAWIRGIIGIINIFSTEISYVRLLALFIIIIWLHWDSDIASGNVTHPWVNYHT
jgi:hypothetical protein